MTTLPPPADPSPLFDPPWSPGTLPPLTAALDWVDAIERAAGADRHGDIASPHVHLYWWDARGRLVVSVMTRMSGHECAQQARLYLEAAQARVAVVAWAAPMVMHVADPGDPDDYHATMSAAYRQARGERAPAAMFRREERRPCLAVYGEDEDGRSDAVLYQISPLPGLDPDGRPAPGGCWYTPRPEVERAAVTGGHSLFLNRFVPLFRVQQLAQRARLPLPVARNRLARAARDQLHQAHQSSQGIQTIDISASVRAGQMPETLDAALAHGPRWDPAEEDAP